MEHALKRLEELQRQLESLRRTTEEVIAESQRLIDDIQSAPATRPAPAVNRGSRKKTGALRKPR
jgi:hypothetical protein